MHGGCAPPLLLVAHPGHELRLFHWMERERPRVAVLTDGSGGAAEPRLDCSRATLAAAGATEGAPFGLASDRAWYAALLARDAAPFEGVVQRLLGQARAHAPALLVSDAVDGHNPMHDLCEAMGAAVVRRLLAEGHAIRHLVAPAMAGGFGTPAETLCLDAEAVARKRLAVAAYTPLAEEARRLVEAEPWALSEERLQHPGFGWPEDWSPDWDSIGRGRVASGRYARAITYQAHARVIAEALRRAG